MVERRYKHAEEEIILKLSKRRLPDLLDEIRALPMDPEVVKEFGRSLSKVKIRMLIYEYPYHQEEKETQQKIVLILMAGYRREVGRKAWDIFQSHADDPYLPKLLQFIFRKEDASFLGLEPHARQQLTDAFTNKGNPIDRLVTLLLGSNQQAADVLSSWKIKSDTVLQSRLIKEMLVLGLADDRILKREGIVAVKSYLENMILEDYKTVLKVYLTHRDYRQFEKEILVQGLQKLGDPRHNRRPWQFLADEEMQKVIQWLMQNDLATFFGRIKDNERFNYWKKYLDFMRDVKVFDEPPVLCMDFGSFVVVEFGHSGAAYFYHREGFYNVVLKKIADLQRGYRSLRSKEYLFKYRDEYRRDGYRLYIHRLPHAGYWTGKFDEHMQHYLRGNFKYQR
ncbi:hypothetical protein GCM10010965_25580 [Caldalkalibacillus thermarum]|nr:hypothetical protein GCM10010965_25580 [Caldalkalibacillus thermarum]